ncbi:hypothetical protein RB195_021859 [Necator americanus]|uniref:Uncharacterized protein n=1 Tax=Necator americanus TaxID=51031 RepID=A0ABR1ED12_NECAM
MRFDDNRWTRAVSDWVPRDIKRTTGRPPTRWSDFFTKSLKEKYDALRVPRERRNHWATLARDRDKWKNYWRPLDQFEDQRESRQRVRLLVGVILSLSRKQDVVYLGFRSLGWICVRGFTMAKIAFDIGFPEPGVWSISEIEQQGAAYPRLREQRSTNQQNQSSGMKDEESLDRLISTMAVFGDPPSKSWCYLFPPFPVIIKRSCLLKDNTIWEELDTASQFNSSKFPHAIEDVWTSIISVGFGQDRCSRSPGRTVELMGFCGLGNTISEPKREGKEDATTEEKKMQQDGLKIKYTNTSIWKKKRNPVIASKLLFRSYEKPKLIRIAIREGLLDYRELTDL